MICASGSMHHASDCPLGISAPEGPAELEYIKVIHAAKLSPCIIVQRHAPSQISDKRRLILYGRKPFSLLLSISNVGLDLSSHRSHPHRQLGSNPWCPDG